MTVTAHETVIGSTRGTLRRLARATRDATGALKELEKAGLGDVLGRYVVQPGETLDEREFMRFVRQVLIEFETDSEYRGGEGLEIVVKTKELRAQGGAESHGTPERLQRG